MDDNKYTKAILVIVEKDGKFLFHKRKNVWADGCWDVPSGHIEKDESLEAASERELKDETGIKCNIFKLMGDWRLSAGTHIPTGLFTENYHYFYMKAVNWEGKPEIKEKDKCSEIGWFDIEEIRKKKLTTCTWYLVNHILAKKYCSMLDY